MSSCGIVSVTWNSAEAVLDSAAVNVSVVPVEIPTAARSAAMPGSRVYTPRALSPAASGIWVPPGSSVSVSPVS